MSKVVLDFGRVYVSEDQALLWAAGRDWGRAIFRQPNFWGQAYGTTFESIPAEVLRWFGVSFRTGFPLVVGAMSLACWWLPAGACWRRGRRGAASAALAYPLLASAEFVTLQMSYAAVAGRLLMAGAVTSFILLVNRRRGVVVAAALAGLAILWDSSAMLLGAPLAVALVAAVAADWRFWRGAHWRRLAAALCIAAGPAVMWLALVKLWYWRHPDEVLHPAPDLNPGWGTLSLNLSHPTRHFSDLAPELLRHPATILTAAVAMVVIAASLRAWVGLAAVLVTAATVIVALSLPRSADGLESIYLPPSRVLLALPLAMWLCAFLIAEASPRRSVGEHSAPARRSELLVCLAAVGLVAGTMSVRVVTWEDRFGGIEQRALDEQRYPLTSTDALAAQCRRTADVARYTGAEFALFEFRTSAYGCAGLFVEPITVFTSYERRAWVLHGADDADRSTAMLVVGTPADCSVADLRCDVPYPDIQVVWLPAGVSPLDAAVALGASVRPYCRGDDSVIDKRC